MVTCDPHTLDEVLGTVLRLGEVTGRDDAAEALVASLRDRLAAVPAPVRPARPRVVVLEWTDPPYAPATGSPRWSRPPAATCVLGAAGEKSVRTTWDAVREARPDVVVVAPCGYDRAGAQAQADALVAAGLLPDGVLVHAVDADAHWARPGPRLVDGVEELAGVLVGYSSTQKPRPPNQSP